MQKQLESLAVSHPVKGFCKCSYSLLDSDEVINHKRLHRIYKHLSLQLRRKAKKRYRQE